MSMRLTLLLGGLVGFLLILVFAPIKTCPGCKGQPPPRDAAISMACVVCWEKGRISLYRVWTWEKEVFPDGILRKK